MADKQGKIQPSNGIYVSMINAEAGNRKGRPEKYCTLLNVLKKFFFDILFSRSLALFRSKAKETHYSLRKYKKKS